MTKIYILDNGSVGSKLLQEEYKGTFDIDVVKVNNSDSLVEQFTKVKNDGTKIFLPFVVEDLVAYNEKLRKEIQEVEALGFKNLLVLPYEGNERKLIEFRAKNAGIKEDITLTGKPVAIAIDADDEMKGITKDEESNKPSNTVRKNRFM